MLKFFKSSKKPSAAEKSSSTGVSEKAVKRKSSVKQPTMEEHLEKLYKTHVTVGEAQDKLGIEIDEDAYIELLSKLIGESEKLQNFPPELIPQEDLAVAHVMNVLEQYSTENGGVLSIETFDYVPGRSNVIIRYSGAQEGCPTVSLIGSHLDVVPAVAENWERDPFTLTREGDKLYGRGTTDCLGHIALVTLFMEQLAVTKPTLNVNVAAVFIASEEAIDKPFTGIDALEREGHLDSLKNGVCLWIDASDSEPCMGTAGALQWHLTATGKRFHSGLPHMAINPIELVNEAMKNIQDEFYKRFPPHPEEARYRFHTCSTIKPTQMKCAKGGINQIPPTATLSGDIRLTPFYDCGEVAQWMSDYVKELNETKFAKLDTRGPVSKYELPKENLLGKLELEWAHEGSPELMSGIACDIDSPGFLALCDSVKSVRGDVKPYSVNGSLPLVFQMKNAGYNLMITGFGKSDAYHAVNEYCLLSDMLNAGKILSTFVSKLDEHYKQ